MYKSIVERALREEGKPVPDGELKKTYLGFKKYFARSYISDLLRTPTPASFEMVSHRELSPE